MSRQPGASSARASRAAIGALQAALAAEQAACYGYGVVGAYLSGTAAAAANTDWVAHEVARDDLTAMIAAAGADPVPAAVAYQLPIRVQSSAQATSLAVAIEVGLAQAYMGLVALGDPALRALGARGVAAAALRAAAWRGSTVAFPGLPASSLRG